jgi:mono/diheme cytochrome c family protein
VSGRRIRRVLIGCAVLSGAATRSEGQTVPRYGVGRPATRAEIAAWDIDVNPAGAGLPAGRGTAADGARVFAAKCAVCHGANGEGLATGPALVGREPREGFPFGQSLKYTRTVGNYWPYATTLYDYINRAMPATAPGSLTADEIYGVVAWILSRNEIIDSTAVMDAASLPRVRMPARDRFVPDDRRPGARFR